MEFLIDSITSQDNSLKAYIINIRSKTNAPRSYFEGASSHLIEVDPYQRYKKSNPTKTNPVKVSAVTFTDGLKQEWNFVGTLDRNLEIFPVIIRMN